MERWERKGDQLLAYHTQRAMLRMLRRVEERMAAEDMVRAIQHNSCTTLAWKHTAAPTHTLLFAETPCLHA